MSGDVKPLLGQLPSPALRLERRRSLGAYTDENVKCCQRSDASKRPVWLLGWGASAGEGVQTLSALFGSQSAAVLVDELDPEGSQSCGGSVGHGGYGFDQREVTELGFDGHERDGTVLKAPDRRLNNFLSCEFRMEVGLR